MLLLPLRAFLRDVRREAAEQFIANAQRDDAKLASHLRIVECELEAGGRN